MVEQGQTRSRRQLRRPGSPRLVRHEVKVTADQEARLTAKAAARGVTVSRLLVESALAGGADAAAVKAALASEFFAVVRVLGKIGVNVNQLARAANATGEVPPAAAHALDAITRVCDRLQGLIDDVEKGAG